MRRACFYIAVNFHQSFFKQKYNKNVAKKFKKNKKSNGTLKDFEKYILVREAIEKSKIGLSIVITMSSIEFLNNKKRIPYCDSGAFLIQDINIEFCSSRS